jgi:hypothetical protein
VNGLVLSASTFYDDVYHQHQRQQPGQRARYNKPGAAERVHPRRPRFHGGYTRLLDAYVFNTFDLGEGRTRQRAPGPPRGVLG